MISFTKTFKTWSSGLFLGVCGLSPSLGTAELLSTVEGTMFFEIKSDPNQATASNFSEMKYTVTFVGDTKKCQLVVADQFGSKPVPCVQNETGSFSLEKSALSTLLGFANTRGRPIYQKHVESLQGDLPSSASFELSPDAKKRVLRLHDSRMNSRVSIVLEPNLPKVAT